MLNIDICVSSSRKIYLDGIAQWIILYMCSQEISPQPAEESAPIKQNDSVVHHGLNSGWNVINLYKPWKQCLHLVSDSDRRLGSDV